MSKGLEKKIIDICVFLHTELSSMQSQLDDSIMELSEVLRLDPYQALELIVDSIKDLLKVKRNFIQMDEYKSYKAHEQYQKALQKLESEVRNHIKIEQQMKLHIDSTQAKIEELEKFKDDRSNQGNLDMLRKENFKLTEKIKLLEKQLDNGEDKARYIKELTALKNIAHKDALKNSELMKVNHQLETELGYMKRKVEILSREVLSYKGNYKENRPDSGHKRKSYEDHNEEIRVISSQLTERCRNSSKNDLKKGNSKSPISRVDLKRAESQFLSSARGIKKCSTMNDRVRKQTHASSSN